MLGGGALLSVGLPLLQGLLPPVSAWLMRTVVDELGAVLADSSRGWARLVWLLGLLGAVLLLGTLVGNLWHWWQTVACERLWSALCTRLHRQALRLDLADIEDKEFHNRLYRARSEARSRALALLSSSAAALGGVTSLAGLTLLLIRYHPLLPLLLALGAAPACYVSLHEGRQIHAWSNAYSEKARRAAWLDGALTGREMAMELRLYGLAAPWADCFRTLQQELCAGREVLAKRSALARGAVEVSGLLLAGGALLWLLPQAGAGRLSLGDLLLLYGALNQGSRAARALLDSVGQSLGHAFFIDDLLDLESLQPRLAPPQKPLPPPTGPADIVLDAVTFRYRGAATPAIQNLTLVLPAGRLVVVLGPNGAGKSTLARLLARLDDPECGTIRWGGVDLQAMDPAALRSRVAILPQQPLRYPLTAADNIAVGDWAQRGDAMALRDAAVAADADAFLCRLPAGYDTLLGREYEGGVDLSGGQWQRLALARVLLRTATLIVLDEPTLHLDPESELQWLHALRCRRAAATVILVTHRLQSAWLADWVVVLENGRLREQGTATQLVRAGGWFARIWAQTGVGRMP